MTKSKTLKDYLFNGGVAGKKFTGKNECSNRSLGRMIFYEIQPKGIHPNESDSQTRMWVWTYHLKRNQLRKYQIGFNLALHLDDRLYRKTEQ